MPLYWRINGVEGGGVEGSDDMRSLSLSRDCRRGFSGARYNRLPVKQTVTIRPFEKSDLTGILRMERESFDHDAWPRETFLEYAAAAPDLFLVARADAHIAGYSVACLTRHGAEIASLAVRPRFRERGVATALLSTTFRKLRRLRSKTVWLMVRRKNEEAIGLYRKLGFVRTETVPDYYDDHASGWRMRMSLDKQ
jgi:ribosomal-protein-alanine N-acetyltransferase